jgi:hypothetical protein
MAKGAEDGAERIALKAGVIRVRMLPVGVAGDVSGESVAARGGRKS